ncbi:HoxN/HupN/NixA family nickel/cobalt transporter [Vibrio methylphosphonaticus]|uniref:HoxN/HupN/NixA family nickel/cobalt transporter n=1 Tax=Vibrio methylphosphonaticus TaxID=2946866 RepID=UPI00202AAF4B|nr:hypothetical protein [Vibrio methylphosphonaticus]MCL9773587.1 hypothetical protein [Vibrio methylphosphonaticus]
MDNHRYQFKQAGVILLVSVVLIAGLYWIVENWVYLRWQLHSLQRMLLEQLTDALEASQREEGAQLFSTSQWAQWLVVLAVCGYGFVHSLGPGHGKSVLLIAMQASKPTLRRIAGFSLAINVVQGLSTWLVASALQWILVLGFKDTIALVGSLNQWVGAGMLAIGGFGVLKRVFLLSQAPKEKQTEPSQRPFSGSSAISSSYGVMLVVALRPCLSTSLIFLYTALWFEQSIANLLLIASFVGSFLSLLLVSFLALSVQRRFVGQTKEEGAGFTEHKRWQNVTVLAINFFYMALGWTLLVNAKVTMSPIF